jgi:hypothetical protein
VVRFMDASFLTPLTDFDAWFDAGESAYRFRPERPDCYPPVGEHEIQRMWLAGVGSAAADAEDGRATDELIADVLRDRPELLASVMRGRRLRQGMNRSVVEYAVQGQRGGCL